VGMGGMGFWKLEGPQASGQHRSIKAPPFPGGLPFWPMTNRGFASYQAKPISSLSPRGIFHMLPPFLGSLPGWSDRSSRPIFFAAFAPDQASSVQGPPGPTSRPPPEVRVHFTAKIPTGLMDGNARRWLLNETPARAKAVNGRGYTLYVCFIPSRRKGSEPPRTAFVANLAGSTARPDRPRRKKPRTSWPVT